VIRAIGLRNFKCFDELDLPLGPLTLLSGINGMGKSSIIQSLLLLRQSFQRDLLRGGKLALNGELVQIGTAQDALYEEADEESIGFALAWQSGSKARWTFRYDRSAELISASDYDAPAAVFGESLFGDRCQYLCAERLGPRIALPVSDLAVVEHRQLGTRGDFTVHFLSRYGHEPVACAPLRHPDATSPALVDQVEAWLGTISPGTRIGLTTHDAMDLVQVAFSFASSTGMSRSYRPTNVGFGISYTLPVLVAVLAAAPGSLVLLENPEAHLHPRGQARMGEFLALAASAGVQIVVETHSDHVLNGIRLAVHGRKLASEAACLHFFSRVEADGRMRRQVISPRVDRRGRIEPWPQDFFDEWDKSLEALLSEPGEP
jgi:predicted ATPase